MPVKSYPFIDIAVHERVREHFTRGDAAVLFSPDLGNTLWSNGEGATLFGFSSVYDFLDAGAERGDVAFRQLQAAARQLTRSGERRNFVMRLASGFKSVPVNAVVEMITVRAGETAILFSAPRSGRPLTLAESAERMISGLDDEDTHMAVLDRDGGILAASPGFAGLAMTPQTRQLLVATVSRDRDWLIKRPVPTGKGHLPAAIGKLSVEPALHLLFAVETILGNLDAEETFEPTVDEALVAAAETFETSGEAAEPEADEVLTEIVPDVTTEADSASVENSEPEPLLESEDEAAPLPEPETPVEAAFTAEGFEDDVPHYADEALASVQDEAGEDVADIDAPAEPAADAESDLSVDEPVTDIIADEPVPSEVEETAADAGQPDDVAENPAVKLETEGFHFDPQGRPVRFVWKIDAAGRFSEISDEFATAVGPHSADVVGRTFIDLAARYDLDPDNTITDLLKRRDTWSGKTIFWPVEGETLVVPVDLAALPTYSRNREFDGFRGFGIVRVADAVQDSRVVAWASEQSSEQQETAPEVEEAVAEETPPAFEPPQPAPEADLFADLETPAKADAEDGDDPFRGERPALSFSETLGRRETDKVVMLDTHRKGPTETLSRNEQAAFREIARQLGGPFDQRTTEGEAPRKETAAEDPLTGLEKQVATPADDEDRADLGAAETLPEDTTSAPQEPAAVEMMEEAAASEPEQEADVSPILPAPVLPARTSESASLTPELIDELPVAMLIHSGDELYHANPEFLVLTGYGDLDELKAEGGIDALFAGDEDGLTDLPAGTVMLLRNDGRMLSVAARLQSVRWQDKSALMLALAPAASTAIDVKPDVAEAASTEAAVTAPEVEALQMQVEELHSILETATDGVVVIGTDNEIRSLNRSASALFNYDDGDIRGKPFASLFAHESQKAVLDYLAGLSGHGVASVLNDGREVIGREAGGGFIPLFMTMGRLSSSSGYCAVIRDITQWKRTEEELRNAKRAAETANAHKTEFLARVSHEIRTPLNAIIGFSDMMASEHFGPIGTPRYIEYASDIGRSGRHVLDIVNDLLDISKIEAGEMELEFSAVDINEQVSEAVSLVQPQANGQRVIIRTSLSGAVPQVVADGRSIKQMALNILSNAIRFTPSGGQIVVSTAYEANGSVILRIRDTGIGMSRSELEQAMKPFRQVTTGARKRGDGTGLGLPLTKAMAEANRAQFAISSTPNEGTLVEVNFPSQRVLAN
ncbi:MULTISPECIES: PAS domain-containing sensor histidine kinase [unclassified Rhizobium]|uniref:sensor histidine kinase n=1 Tax=unclassified Rhizobium TaxID=2613769 RepID=UPI0006FEB530|nr:MULTISPECIES: PAS domain-containing sensor histidine kinase [unclassified Rhizobium]KQV43837.1 PAS domain-containing sensor histidine kinase [Rhizobium sp. Root1212]KRD38020.1 PAS domain-containing sensor histidine kinase [Rhizobium sp. Root268]